MHHFRLKPQHLKLREDDVEQACVDLLLTRGWMPLRLHCGRFKTPDGERWITGLPKGTPDYAALHRNFPPFLLETKRPKGGVLSTDQIRRHREIAIGFGIAIVVTKNVDHLREWLNAWERTHG